MKQQPEKIFDLFKENQHKLNERPSLQAWNKLERRLDQKGRKEKRQKPSLSIYSIIMAAAAMVGLVFFITTIADVSKVAASKKAIVIKEEKVVKQFPTYQLVAEQAFREKHQEILNNSIEEGSTGRLVVVNKAVRPFLIPKRS